MPLQSMTGYADAQESIGNPDSVDSVVPSNVVKSRLGIEIRGVNSRFLDLSFKLPEEMRASEPRLHDLFSKRLCRGKVEVRIYQDYNASGMLTVPSSQWLQKLDSLQSVILNWIPQCTPLSVADIIRLSSTGAQTNGVKNEKVLLLAEMALESFIQSRLEEGGRLCNMLLGHVSRLRKIVEKSTILITPLLQLQKDKFFEKWNAAAQSLYKSVPKEVIHERMLNEVTSYAFKIDVSEELTRLESHLVSMEALLKKGGEVGKRLDFITQELHREANTLGSKSGSLELSQLSMEMKVLIEQMRQQVQNLE